MQRKFFGSLRRQFSLLTISSVLVILIMTVVFLTQARNLTEIKNVSFVHTLLEQLTGSLNQVGSEMVYLGNAVYSNETLQQYYHAQSPVQRMAKPSLILHPACWSTTALSATFWWSTPTTVS